MRDDNETPPFVEIGKTVRRPILNVITIVYVALALVAVAVPEGIVGWVRDLKPGKVQNALLPAAEALEATSKAVRLDAPYKAVRSRFLEWTGKTDQ